MFNDTSSGKSFAQFYVAAVHQPFKSEQQGRPFYEDREFVRIMIPGDSKTEFVREATDLDKSRFADAYRAFQQAGGHDAQIVGTPLSQVTWLTPSQVMELKAQNVHTVEHLAGLSDSNLQTIGLGGRELKAKAQAFLDAAAGVADIGKFAAENELLKTEIEDLKKQVRELAQLADNQKRKSAA